MRMRKKKNLAFRMEACAELWVKDPAGEWGRWRARKPDAHRLRLELGCAHGLIFHRVFPPHSSPKGWYCPLLYYGSPQKASGQTAPFPT